MWLIKPEIIYSHSCVKFYLILNSSPVLGWAAADRRWCSQQAAACPPRSQAPAEPENTVAIQQEARWPPQETSQQAQETYAQ